MVTRLRTVGRVCPRMGVLVALSRLTSLVVRGTGWGVGVGVGALLVSGVVGLLVRLLLVTRVLRPVENRLTT